MRRLALLLALLLAPQTALAGVAAFPETALRVDREISARRAGASARQVAEGRLEKAYFYGESASAIVDDPINHRDPTGMNLERDLAACKQIDTLTPGGLERSDQCEAAAWKAHSGFAGAWSAVKEFLSEDVAPSAPVQAILAADASLRETAEFVGQNQLNNARSAVRSNGLEYSRSNDAFVDARAKDLSDAAYETGRDTAILRGVAGLPSVRINVARGVSLAARTGKKDVALGFSKLRGEFKQTVPHAQHWEELGLRPNTPGFVGELRAEMDAANSIHFNLTDMRELNSPKGVLKGPVGWNAPGSTNWELRTIWDDPALLRKTTFYRDGKVIGRNAISSLP